MRELLSSVNYAHRIVALVVALVVALLVSHKDLKHTVFASNRVVGANNQLNPINVPLPSIPSMKTLDIIAAVLLVLGGLNWGLYGLFETNLVSSVAGASAVLAQVIYGAIGLAALYQVFSLRAIQRRWNVSAVQVS